MANLKAPASSTKRFPKATPAGDAGRSPAELIDARIKELEGWRVDLLSRLRAVIKNSDREVAEEWKWNVPVWSCNGLICTGETYTKAVKLTFAKGASLGDPSKLFNSSLEGSTRRAIDFPQGANIDEAALSTLIQAAIKLNKASAAGKASSAA